MCREWRVGKVFRVYVLPVCLFVRSSLSLSLSPTCKAPSPLFHRPFIVPRSRLSAPSDYHALFSFTFLPSFCTILSVCSDSLARAACLLPISIIKYLIRISSSSLHFCCDSALIIIVISSLTPTLKILRTPSCAMHRSIDRGLRTPSTALLVARSMGTGPRRARV